MKSFIFALFYLIPILLTGCNGDSDLLGESQLENTVTELQVTPPAASIPIGFHQQYQANAILEDASVIDVTTNPALSWNSSDPAIASIDRNTGIATGEMEGTVTITASGTANGIPFSQTAQLTITNAIVISLQVTPAVASVPIGFTQGFIADATFSDGTVIDVTTASALSWSSSDPAIASIGKNTGISVGEVEGTVTITASGIVNGTAFSQTAELTVNSAIITNFQVTPAVANVPIGFTQDFTAEIIFSDFSVIDVTTNSLVSWSSSNSAIATIDSTTGIATGVTEGTVTITASGTSSNGTDFSQTAELTVTSAIITNLQVTPAVANVPIGFTQDFTAEIIFSDFSVIDVTTNSLVSWSSSNPAIATIDNTTGIATGVTEGIVTITASGTSSNGTAFSQTAELTVTSAVITSFRVTPAVENVPIGLIQGFTAEIIFSDLSVIDVTTNPALSWSSSEPTIATISRTIGVATGVMEGVVTITAAGTSSSGIAFSATAELTVTNAIVTSIEVMPLVDSVPVRLSRNFTAEIIFSDFSVIDVTTNPVLSWSSSNPTIATIDSTTGIATGVTEGIVTITASGTSSNGTVFRETAELTVTSAIITNLQVMPAVDNVPIGFTRDFTAEIIFSDFSIIDVTTNPALSWSSSDPLIGTIGSMTGIATGVAEGVVTITAAGTSSNGTVFSETAQLTVTPAILVTVLLDKPSPLSITEYFGEQLHATGTYSDGRTVSFNDTDCSWGTTNVNIPIADGLIAPSMMYGETGEVFATCENVKSNEVTATIIQANKSSLIGTLTGNEYLIKQSDTSVINFHGEGVIDGVYNTNGNLLAGGLEGSDLGDTGDYTDNMVLANVSSIVGLDDGNGFGGALNRLNWVESPATNKHVGKVNLGNQTAVTVTSQVFGILFYGTAPVGSGYISGMVVIYK